MYDGVNVLYSTSNERAECRSHSGASSLSVAGVVGSTHASHGTRERTIRSHQTQLSDRPPIHGREFDVIG